MSGQAGNGPQEVPAPATAPALDTRHAHSARVYNYWLGGEDNFSCTLLAVTCCDLPKRQFTSRNIASGR